MGGGTPLGLGMHRVGRRLGRGDSGVHVYDSAEFRELGLKCDAVCATVPHATEPTAAAATATSGGIDKEGKEEHATPDAFHAHDWVPRAQRSGTSRFIQYGMAAATQALRDARWHPRSEFECERTGVCVGSGIGSSEDMYEAGAALHSGRGPRRVSPYTIPRSLVNLAAGNISIQHGLRGPNHSASTACATGAHSIGDAFRFIQHGDADAMLCGGTEASVSPFAMTLFARCQALAAGGNADALPQAASRPFDAARRGFVMGEGACVLVLEELEHALARDANIYAEVLGYGLSGDAHHITSSDPEGRGAAACMRNGNN
jgi:3-oxoacyl-[acyl-carrier-protein] synthase II